MSLLVFNSTRLSVSLLIWLKKKKNVFFSPDGSTDTCRAGRLRSCWRRRARTAASWWERARVTLATSSCQSAPETTRRTAATASLKSPTSWSAVRWVLAVPPAISPGVIGNSGIQTENDSRRWCKIIVNHWRWRLASVQPPHSDISPVHACCRPVCVWIKYRRV